MPALPGLGAVMAGFAASFTPVTYDLDSGSTSLTIPSGATGYEIWVVGAGGGAAAGSLNPAGGGGGGRAYLSGIVLPGEWGTNLSRTVGAAGVGESSNTANDATAGGDSTLSGTIGGVAISLVGNGGGATNDTTGGTGGAASGGSSNLSGSAGDAGSSGGAGGAPGEYVGTGSRGQGGDGVVGGPGGSGVGGRIRVKFT